MTTIDDIETLEAMFDAPSTRALTKVARHLTPLYRQWIGASPFCILSTVGPEGTDASPRGDDGPVVRIADDTTIWLPDWRGNHRLDSLRNIVRDGRVSLMFMVPGSDTVVRVNGRAAVTVDADVTGAFVQRGKHPKLVVVTTVGEVYFQCAKAVTRSQLWDRSRPDGLPTPGAFLKEMEAGFDAEGYDAGYAEYAAGKMW